MNGFSGNAACRVAVALLLGVAWLSLPADLPAGGPDETHTEPRAPTLEEAAAATYTGIGDAAVTLADGRWEGDPFVAGGASRPAVGLVSGFRLVGDLDGDGAAESVVLLWSTSGGSGTFDYLAVLARRADGTVLNRATAPLGDRVDIRSAEIAGGQIIVHTVQAGPDDAMCCPGQKMRRVFGLEDGNLVEQEPFDEGRLSLADLDGDWRLTHFARGEAVAPDIEVTLGVADGRVAGKAACNRYSGAVSAGSVTGELTLSGPLAVTRMACPPPQMEAEQRFLGMLENLRSFSFSAGSLLLQWQDDAGAGALTFSRTE
jgi:heat shock protein HslJ